MKRFVGSVFFMLINICCKNKKNKHADRQKEEVLTKKIY